jgi:hypothetical protein
MELEANDLARLRSQVSRGELILFTGAGFSIGAKDHSGRPIPSVSELKKELWQLLYPGELYDAYSSIGDLYGAAMRQKKADLTNLLQSRLTVRPEDLPEYYLPLFNFPWFRCYTLTVVGSIQRKPDYSRQKVSPGSKVGRVPFRAQTCGVC